MRLGFWRKCRVCFRWCRRTVLVAAVVVICALVWFNRVGLPDFLKARLVGALRERGIELDFFRLRLSPVRGIVADNVLLGGLGKPGSPVFLAQQIQLGLKLVF